MQNDELRRALEARQDGRHLLAAEDVRQMPGLAGADHILEPIDFGLEDVAVEEEDGGSGFAERATR